MSLSNTAETAILDQIFRAVALPWNANTNLWIALHTTDPGEAGTALAAEANYTSYARIAVNRAAGFNVSGNTVNNVNLLQFPQSTGGSNTITYASIVTTASGAGDIVVRAALSSSISVTTGVQPQFAATALSFAID